MKIPRFDLDSWSEIVDALSKNKLRSFLTAFGIFWGVFMLVLLMGGGRGLESMLGNVFAGFASNSGFMATATTSMPHKGFREGRQWDLELRDIDRVRNSVPEIDILTPTNTRWGISAVRDNKKLNVSITGIYPDYLRVSNPRLKAGRAINDTDIAQERKVCIIGSRIVEELFPGEDEICGQRIQIDGIYYTVIGLSGRSGQHVASNPEEQAIQSDRIRLVRQLINQLPEKQRSCMQLRDMEGKSYKDIATILDITEEQVKVNIFRARQTIREKFKRFL